MGVQLLKKVHERNIGPTDQHQDCPTCEKPASEWSQVRNDLCVNGCHYNYRLKKHWKTLNTEFERTNRFSIKLDRASNEDGDATWLRAKNYAYPDYMEELLSYTPPKLSPKKDHIQRGHPMPLKLPHLSVLFPKDEA